MSPAFAGSHLLLLLTHSLRCRLEEYRQLCWLRSTSAQFFYQIGLFYAAADTLLEQLSFSPLWGSKRELCSR